MNRPYISLAITAVALAFAAAQFNAASASSRAQIRPDVRLPSSLPDAPCALGFKAITSYFSGKGHSYPCIQPTVIVPICKMGYHLSGPPHVIKRGNQWTVRYWCQSPPH